MIARYCQVCRKRTTGLYCGPCASAVRTMADVRGRGCNGVIRPAHVQAEYERRIERYMERAALGLPLFG